MMPPEATPWYLKDILYITRVSKVGLKAVRGTFKAHQVKEYLPIEGPSCTHALTIPRDYIMVSLRKRAMCPS